MKTATVHEAPIAAPTPKPTRQHMLDLLQRLDEVQALARDLKADPDCVWEERDLVAIDYQAEAFSSILLSGPIPFDVEQGHAIRQGVPHAMVLDLRRRGKPVPADLMARFRRELAEMQEKATS